MRNDDVFFERRRRKDQPLVGIYMPASREWAILSGNIVLLVAAQQKIVLRPTAHGFMDRVSKSFKRPIKAKQYQIFQDAVHYTECGFLHS